MWFGLVCTRRAIRRQGSKATNMGSSLAVDCAWHTTALIMGYVAVKVDAMRKQNIARLC
jgi:hypothetical protein